MPFQILPLGALGGVGVAAVQAFPWHKNITMGAPWMGEVALLQEDYVVPYVTFQEMHLEICPHYRPPPSPLDGVVQSGPTALGKYI